MTTDSIKSLIAIGRDLAKDLQSCSAEYHVKSSQHEILGWESAIVTAKLDYLQNHTDIPENLRHSTLLSEWGRILHNEVPDFVDRVTEFHDSYRNIVGD